MTEYYKEKLEQGKEYQDFVMDRFADELAIIISVYGSEKRQLSGESTQGIEIKLDDRYAETGNLYIEYAEKSDINNDEYVDSGVLRQDNTWLWAIGDYKRVFIFAKSCLRRLYEAKTILKYIEIEKETSKGFLLPNQSAEKYAAKIIEVQEQLA